MSGKKWACALCVLCCIGGLATFVALSAARLFKESDDYYEAALGNPCQGDYYMRNVYDDLFKDDKYKISDFRIGPCGHAYVRQGTTWHFAHVKESNEVHLMPVRIGDRDIDCGDCIIRVDQRGHLWFRLVHTLTFGVESHVNCYNPFYQTLGIITAIGDKNDIEHVAFKEGRVYALGADPGGQRGLFIL